uniref:Uncharacterized protein n=1 Tax=Hyaloperonospora arabidopsidis (strain Emoy2) TaxID=559515 RepID=M4C379_HYAAE
MCKIFDIVVAKQAAPGAPGASQGPPQERWATRKAAQKLVMVLVMSTRRGLTNRVVPIRPQPGLTQRCENVPDAPPHPFRCFSILWETDRKECLSVRGYVDDTPACARIKEIVGPPSRWPLPRPVSDQLFPQ